MFDYPTVADLTDFILSQFAPDDADDQLLAGGDLSATREPLSMLGIAGRYPGMSAQNDVSELLGLWILMETSRDRESDNHDVKYCFCGLVGDLYVDIWTNTSSVVSQFTPRAQVP